jgi:hypothetical protein
VATATSHAEALADKQVVNQGAVTFPTWSSDTAPGSSIFLGISLSLTHS